jgi:hypothetical protein
MAQYQCPKCKSNRVKASYPDIKCLACGWSESLIDYPLSFNEHRRLCREFGKTDPGSDEPPEHNLSELHERILALENAQAERPELESWSEPKPRLSGGVRL